MSVESGIAVEASEDGAAEVVTVRPIGFAEFVRWFEKQSKDGPKTIDELVEAYPGEITKGSFQAKLSKMRAVAQAKGYKLSPTKRAGRTSGNEVDIDALAAELNLTRLTSE